MIASATELFSEIIKLSFIKIHQFTVVTDINFARALYCKNNRVSVGTRMCLAFGLLS